MNSRCFSRLVTTGMAGALMASPAQSHAEDDDLQSSGPTQAEEIDRDAQIFEPGYFEQFAPRNAFDMLVRLPGFAIAESNQGERGLGEADQNVIVNGARLSSKSEDVEDQLGRIPAGDVVRIEILDGTTLDIPGLSGQVANVVVASSGGSGQFEWIGGFRPHNTDPQFLAGEISWSDTNGDLDYTLSLSNTDNRFGYDGPTRIEDGDGNLIESQTISQSGRFDSPTLAANLTYDFSPQTRANLNLSYSRDFFDTSEPEIALRSDGSTRVRDVSRRSRGPRYEFSGDLEFPLGPGKLKLIGLERFERDDFVTELVDSFDDGTPATGSRFAQVSDNGERIGRMEFAWPMWGGDWQISGEAAFNRLNREAELFTLAPGGGFEPVSFPGATGGVTEDRYETIISYSRGLTSKLAMQASIGAENSTLKQTGSAANSRTFKRPKGAFALSWKPASDFDASIELRRRVGQLSFGDFLASVSLNEENELGANNQLVPNQSWNLELEANKRLGPWGSVKIEADQAWFEDFVEFVPLPSGGEARGNIGDAQRLQLRLTATLKGEPIGLNGVQLDVVGIQRWMNVTDPFTGEERDFSSDRIDLLEFDLRHDISGSGWAWGGLVRTTTNTNFVRRFEVGRGNTGPTWVTLFIEHKDVFGLTVQANAENVIGARNDFSRTVFDGDRVDGNILFREISDRRIGPTFRLIVSGNL